MELTEGVACAGRLSIAVRDAATGRLAARRAAPNLVVTTGIAMLAQALNYALVLAENASWGSPYSAPVGAMYAVVGTGSTPPAAGNTALGAEIGRALVTNSAVSAGVLSYDFFMPTSIGNGTINELGTFGAAGFLTPALAAQVTAGTTGITSLAVSGVVGTIPASSTLTLGYGTATTQTVTTSAQANIGDTAISVSSFTASATFAAGSLAAYTPGTLIDRVVLGSPVTKTAAQTATVSLSLTLTSA